MDGFKNSTKTQYMKGGSCDGYAKGGKAKGAAKINKVMGEFKRGELHSGSKKGPEVTSKKQATAIAMSEARKAGAKMKYMCGGPVRKAPKGVMKSASSAKQLPTPEVASKRQVQPTPPKDVVREAPRPTVEPKRQVQPTPPTGAKTIGGAAQTMGGASRDAKAIGSVGVVKKGVPVASNKPMIGLKTGGHVTKSMCKW